MNSTNRAMNRIFLIVIGAALLAAGLIAVAVSVLPGWAGYWRQTAPSIEQTLDRADTVGLAFVGLTHVSWVLLAIPVAAAIVIAALLFFVFTQGRGHTARVVDGLPLPTAIAEGSLAIDAGVAAEVLRHALTSSRLLAGVAVDAYRIQGATALKLSLTLRRGADPIRAMGEVEHAVAEWDELLGRRLPVFVHLTGGMRAALSKRLRVA